MRRRWVVIIATLSALLCVSSGFAWLATATIHLDSPQERSPGLVIAKSYPWLGWTFVTAGGIAVALTTGLQWTRKTANHDERAFPVIFPKQNSDTDSN